MHFVDVTGICTVFNIKKVIKNNKPTTKTSQKKKQKLESLAIRYKSHETFIIATEARKTIRFIERGDCQT